MKEKTYYAERYNFVLVQDFCNESHFYDMEIYQ